MNTSHILINNKSLAKITRSGAVILSGLLLLTAVGCKKNFEQNATDGTGIPDSEIKLPTLLPQMVFLDT